MWTISKPGETRLRAFLERQQQAEYSYREVGETLKGAPMGYSLDHNRVRLGRGEAVFAAACDAMRGWRMFPRPWTEIFPANAAQCEGTIVAMQANAVGLWWLNAARIVYAIDEAAPVRRFGFAYGTLRDHVEQGEERFTIELLADGAVWYDLLAFSRPRYWAVRLAKPMARRLQRQFVRDSQRAMVAAVREVAVQA